MTVHQTEAGSGTWTIGSFDSSDADDRAIEYASRFGDGVLDRVIGGTVLMSVRNGQYVILPKKSEPEQEKTKG